MEPTVFFTEDLVTNALLAKYRTTNNRTLTMFELRDYAKECVRQYYERYGTRVNYEINRTKIETLVGKHPEFFQEPEANCIELRSDVTIEAFQAWARRSMSHELVASFADAGRAMPTWNKQKTRNQPVNPMAISLNTPGRQYMTVWQEPGTTDYDISVYDILNPKSVKDLLSNLIYGKAVYELQKHPNSISIVPIKDPDELETRLREIIKQNRKE